MFELGDIAGIVGIMDRLEEGTRLVLAVAGAVVVVLGDRGELGRGEVAQPK
ncbi:MAG: hypothetical protein ACYC1T_11520 [Sulfuricaulis sp.]